MSTYPIYMNALREDLKRNHQTTFILSKEQLVDLAKEKSIPLAKQIAGNSAAAIDLITLTKLVKELGFTGKVIQKRVSGKTYVIFKGNPSQRKILSGTRYLANNLKVLDLAVGSAGIKQSVRSGARLTVFFTVPLIVVEHLFKDKLLLSELFADLAISLIKVGIASIFAAVAGVAMGTVTTVAAAPLAVAIFVGLAAGWGLDKLDGKYGLLHRLAKVLREFEDATFGEFRRGMWELEKRLRWQILNGQQVGKGIYY